MTFVVTDNCIKCKYTDCVEVCPVDCFYEGPNFLVIDPDECIDCALCEPECPAEAIFSEDELPADQVQFVELNADLVDWSKNESESHPHAIPNDPVSAGAGPGSVTGGATNTSSARKNTDMENLEKEDSFDQSRDGLNPMLQSAFGGPGAAGGPAGNIANQIAAAAQNLSQTAHALGGAVDQQGVPNPKAQSVPNTPGTEMLTPATQQAMAR